MTSPFRRLAVGLALATAGCDFDDGARPAGPALPGGADQLLVGISTTLATGGIHRVRLTADTALVRDRAGTVEARRVRAVLLTAEGGPGAVLTAGQVTFHVDSATFEAAGDVVVATPTLDTLRTGRLVYDIDRRELRGDSAWVLASPVGGRAGTGFTADLTLKRIGRGRSAAPPG